MSTTSPRTVVSVRIATQHVEQLREIADANASTVSRIVARALALWLDDVNETSNDDRS
jgi:predicted transcriptional regulator